MTKENQSGEHENVSRTRPRLIAFYLPQYHPIPENDEWWGKGFTEWTNVVKAKPLFKGHYQPHLPADLGFYDLRVPEVREQQAQLAREAGIEGFCYWHYWFAGKRLLERPFNEVLASGKPDFPFCLAWANESWSGIWHGAPGKILMEQTYPGAKDYQEHFLALLPAFQDRRYIQVDGQPLFVLYRPSAIPDLATFTSLWKKLAKEHGLKGIYFVGSEYTIEKNARPDLDGWIMDSPCIRGFRRSKKPKDIIIKAINKLTRVNWQPKISRLFYQPFIYITDDFSASNIIELIPGENEFPTIVPSWDNTPRSGYKGSVWIDSTPEFLKFQLRHFSEKLSERKVDHQIIFIKSWNEWAEGNYLEPDQKYGRSYLNAIRDQLESMN